MHEPGAAFQTYFCEASCGGTQIEYRAARRVELVVVECSDQFQCTTGDPGQVFTEQFYRGFQRDLFSGFAHFHPVYTYAVKGDDALGPRPTGDQTAVDKEPVQADGVHQFQPRRSA